MKKAIRKISLPFILFSFQLVHADDQINQRNVETYKENFVKEIMNDMTSAHGTAAMQIPELPKQFQSQTTPDKSEESEDETHEWLGDGAAKKVKPTKIERIIEEKPGVKVRSIGAILALSNAKNMNNDISTLVATANHLNVGMGHVFFVLGSFELPQVSREMLEPLQKAGADTHIRLAPPTEYKGVKSTPTWIVSTEKGDVLLEGSHEPLSFFNSRGEFVEPERALAPKEDKK